MDYDIFLYGASSLIAIYWWFGVLSKYRNLGGIFFFSYTIFACIWGILYFLFFSELDIDKESRLMISRIAYWISPIVLVSFLLFISQFKKTDWSIPIGHIISENLKLIFWFSIFAWFIFYISAFTDLIVLDIVFDEKTSVYREVAWDLWWLNHIVYLGFIPTAYVLFLKNMKKLTYIDKVRLSKVAWWKLIFLSIIITIQIILPFFGIWILEDEIILFFSISVLIVAGIVKRYYFSPIWHELWRVIAIIVLVLIIAFITWMNLHNNILLREISSNPIYSYSYVLYYVWIIIFVFFGGTALMDRYIFTRIEDSGFTKRLRDIKRWMTQFTDYNDLNNYIKKNFLWQFPTKDIEIIRLSNKKDRSFYTKIFWGLKEKILINDFVYLEENNIDYTFSQIWISIDDPFLCIPISDQGITTIGLLILGRKKYSGFYSKKEVEFLYDFTHILSIHMKYIETYNQLEDISRNLDRKVDEKTIEYNTLISRQKEFIATLSHEIKAPLTSALLQIDNLSADIEDKRLSEVWIQEEVISIGENLVHTKTLLSQLFTTEYLEKNQAVLYPERVNIVELVMTQYHIQKRVNLHCTYTETTPKNPIFINLDKTQFTQVLTNLFWNAAKFADNKSPKIHLELEQSGNNIIIGIEDNWLGLSGIELDEIFEKYTIGKNSIGLGIGLYLCKKIVEMHDGTITAKKWKELSWIRMEIHIPIEQM